MIRCYYRAMGLQLAFHAASPVHGRHLCGQRTTARAASCQSGPCHSPFHAALPATLTRPLRTTSIAAAKKGKDKEENIYSPTVNLPVTDFNIRGMAKVKEPEIQQWWAEEAVYERLAAENPGPAWTLHDGPPYANGDLHIGHALNKVLKDIIVRRKLLEGYKAKYVPGWDTHGLPIELKVLQTLSDDERRDLTPVALRERAREYALRTVDAQRTQFKRYGVWGHWEEPYVTLERQYEAAQVGVFGEMVMKGHVYRGRKPVHWSPSSRTALAEAELVYPEGHKSRSIYVSMPVSKVAPGADPDLAAALDGAAFAVWTTTPWTIPANLAVAVNDRLQYSVVQLPEELCPWLTQRRIVVAADLVDTLAGKLKAEAGALRVLATVPGAALEGCAYQHPLFDRESPVVIGGDYITTEAGTGLVHTAPGHGQEDYAVGQKHGLPLLSPVDDAGVFTSEAGPFAGLAVQGEGNAAVVEALKGAGALLRAEDYRHKYPYDWRTKQPTIFRATDQWFASVEAFKEDALAAIGQVTWQPAKGQNRITAMVDGRTDWCISRQRTWGVPIPVLYYSETNEPLMTEATIKHIQAIIAQHGSGAWWTLDTVDLLPEALKGEADKLVRGTDTMDVWFDSGSSWAAVLKQTEGLEYPADLYLEGSDQHRGWFQSSLLTSVAVNGHAPYKAVLTHGFVLDEQGVKQSKSTGNVVNPLSIIEGGKNQKKEPAYGADVLRLWAASVDYAVDVSIGAGILKQVFESYRKLRGTLRFMLGNLHDFRPEEHGVAWADLPLMDRHMLARVREEAAAVGEEYGRFNFGAVYRAVNLFVSVDLSSQYFELAKDRLYIRSLDAPQRRSCQTVLHAALRHLLAVMAPVTPHMCEDAWQSLRRVGGAGGAASVFQAGVPDAPEAWRLEDEEAAAVRDALGVKDVAMKALENARAEKAIGAPLDACVVLAVEDAAARARLQALNAAGNGVDELQYLFVTSEVEVADSLDGAGCEHMAEAEVAGVGRVVAGVRRAAGARCERCWHYSPDLGADAEHPHLCGRCLPVVKAAGFSLPAQPAEAVVAP
eukprot:jgi/Ulvmu1/5066/UM021_0083.1